MVASSFYYRCLGEFEQFINRLSWLKSKSLLIRLPTEWEKHSVKGTIFGIRVSWCFDRFLHKSHVFWVMEYGEILHYHSLTMFGKVLRSRCLTKAWNEQININHESFVLLNSNTNSNTHYLENSKTPFKTLKEYNWFLSPLQLYNP